MTKHVVPIRVKEFIGIHVDAESESRAATLACQKARVTSFDPRHHLDLKAGWPLAIPGAYDNDAVRRMLSVNVRHITEETFNELKRDRLTRLKVYSKGPNFEDGMLITLLGNWTRHKLPDSLRDLQELIKYALENQYRTINLSTAYSMVPCLTLYKWNGQ